MCPDSRSLRGNKITYRRLGLRNGSILSGLPFFFIDFERFAMNFFVTKLREELKLPSDSGQNLTGPTHEKFDKKIFEAVMRLQVVPKRSLRC